MKVLLTLVLASSLMLGYAQTDAVRKTNFNVKKQVALEGYDPVSYFSNKPEEGDEKIRISHKGIIYQFASQANLAKFNASPDRYEPAYGGWCAYAMGATGEKVKIDPETFKIINGKLYLFYNFWGNNTLKDWNAEETKLKDAADKNWKKIIQ
jgi:YHS domain-containing protein